jgi:hypothetical protein
MMFGGGRGSPSWLRVVRIALLIGIVVLGATLGHSNGTYNAIHTVYLVIIVALLIASVAYGRSRRGMGGPGGRRDRGNAPWHQDDTTGQGGFGTAPPPATATPPPMPPPETPGPQSAG